MATEEKYAYLITQLNHVIPTMRFNAARALGELGDTRANDALLQIFSEDKSPAVREAARIALIDLGVNLAELGDS